MKLNLAMFLSAILAVGLLSAISCKKTGPSNGPIKIGSASPLSGNQAQTGIDQMRGAQLAVDQLNAAGGILGRPVELVAFDDRADPKEGNNGAQRFAADPEVVAVVGHLNSGCSIPASKIYHDAGLAMITPISTSDVLTAQGFDNVFRICIRNSDQGPAAARLVVEKLHKNNFYILDDKTAYGAGLADEFEKAVRALHANVLGRDSITEGETDFTGLFTKLRDKPIDFIYFGGMYPEAALMLKQARELGVTAPFLGGDGMFSPKLIEIAERAAEGTIVTHIAPLEARNEKARAFFADFHKRFGEDVKVYAPLSYDCVMILAAAMQKAGSADRRAIIDALHAPDFSYDGVIGATRFDAKGDTLNKTPFFYKVQDGKFVLLEP